MNKYILILMLILSAFSVSIPTYANETLETYNNAIPVISIEDAQSLINAVIHGKTQFLKRAYQEHPEWINVLIDVPKDRQDFHVTSVGTSGCTLLHFATYHLKTKVVKLLLSLGADPRISGTVYWYKTPGFEARFNRIFSHNPIKRYKYTKLSNLLEQRAAQMEYQTNHL